MALSSRTGRAPSNAGNFIEPEDLTVTAGILGTTKPQNQNLLEITQKHPSQLYFLLLCYGEHHPTPLLQLRIHRLAFALLPPCDAHRSLQTQMSPKSSWT
jgi:hypothetical protein